MHLRLHEGEVAVSTKLGLPNQVSPFLLKERSPVAGHVGRPWQSARITCLCWRGFPTSWRWPGQHTVYMRTNTEAFCSVHCGTNSSSLSISMIIQLLFQTTSVSKQHWYILAKVNNSHTISNGTVLHSTKQKVFPYVEHNGLLLVVVQVLHTCCSIVCSKHLGHCPLRLFPQKCRLCRLCLSQKFLTTFY